MGGVGVGRKKVYFVCIHPHRSVLFLGYLGATPRRRKRVCHAQLTVMAEQKNIHKKNENLI